MNRSIVALLRGLFSALLIGVVTGGVVALFSSLLEYASSRTFSPPFYLALLPAAMVCSSLLHGGGRNDSSNDRFSRGIYDASDTRSLSRVPRMILAVVVTIAGGGSAGRAGPSAQIGAAVSALLRRGLRTRQQYLTFCGAAAGFSAVLAAPAAGWLLAYGLLRRKPDCLTAYAMGALASAAAAWSAQQVGVPSHHGMYSGAVVLSPLLGLQITAAAVVFSAAGGLYIWALSAARRLCSALPIHRLLAAAAAGLIAALAGIVWSTDYLSLGTGPMNRMFQGVEGYPFGALVKILTTSLTLGAGGTGGVITPMLFIGASAGSSFAAVIGADIGLFAALGAVSLIAVTANAPLAAVVLSLELFGAGMLLPSIWCCLISYLISRHRRFRRDELLLTPPGAPGS